MVRFLYNLILMSISGSIMYVLGIAVHKFTRKRFSSWYYSLLVTASIILIVPLQAVFTIPKIVNIEVSNNVSQTVCDVGNVMTKTNISPVYALFAVWLAVALVYIVFTVIKYIYSYTKLKSLCDETYDDDIILVYNKTRKLLKISKDIKIMRSKHLPSPLLFGITKPTIVIPYRSFSHNELELIFAHELVHYKHKDLPIKLITSIAVSLHWFNPLVYFLRKYINELCELCCDECVLKRMNLKNKKDYGRLLISIIEHSSKRDYSYTTAMASPKDDIQRRLIRIIEFKNTSILFKTVSVMIAISMTVCSLTAFGFNRAKEVLPNNVSDFIEKAVTKPTATDIPISVVATATPITHITDTPKTYDRNKIDTYTANKRTQTHDIPATITPYTTEEPVPTEQTVLATENPTRQIDEDVVVDVSTTSVAFGVNFSEKGESVESAHTFTSDTDTTMSFYASSGSISVIDADTHELIYDGSQSDEKTAKVPVKSGQRCYVSITSTEDGQCNSNVYAYGSIEDYDNDTQ